MTEERKTKVDYVIDNRKDFLLLLLYSPGKTDTPNLPIAGRTRLVKMLFLFKKEVLHHFKSGTKINDDNFYDYFPWNYGPFSQQVYDDITFFNLNDFIKIETASSPSIFESAEEYNHWLNVSGLDNDNEYTEEEFQLTPMGQEFTQKLYELLSSGQKKLLQTFKSKFMDLPLRAILEYVYSKYPEMTENSKIKDQFSQFDDYSPAY